MSATTRVLIRLGRQWSPVGTAAIEEDEETGVRMLRLDMTAMAPQVYVPMKDIAVADEDLTDEDEETPMTTEIIGHA